MAIKLIHKKSNKLPRVNINYLTNLISFCNNSIRGNSSGSLHLNRAALTEAAAVSVLKPFKLSTMGRPELLRVSAIMSVAELTRRWRS